MPRGIFKRESIEVRFWRNVKKIPDGCWIWIGGKFRTGYGRLSIKRRGNLAHRISYEIHNGIIPNGLCVCHHCDNRLCVNPTHFFLGTYKDNMVDKVNKGRQANGENDGNVKLTKKQVKEILNSRNWHGRNIFFAKKFKVHRDTISLITRRLTWKHIN